jgi:DNA-binding protein WhiA
VARARNTFTARVKDELAALRPAVASERRALLAGLLRFAASLHIAGTVGPRYSLVLTTESGAVARLAHWLLAAPGVKLDLRVRSRGALVPRQSYEVVLTEHVEAVLAETGILRPSGALVHALPARLVRGRAAAACYARGALLGRGSLSSPTGAAHLEIGAPSEQAATDLARLLARLELPASTLPRGGGSDAWRVVVKGGDAIGRALIRLGARDAYLAWEDGRIRREVRGGAVRLANADQANLRRSVDASMAQADAIQRVVASHGWEALPPDLATVARLRLDNPQASLAELGALLDPPRSKGAVLARLRRLERLGQDDRPGQAVAERPG